MGFNLGSVLGGVGSIAGGIFGNKAAKKQAKSMEMMAYLMQPDPKMKAWAQSQLDSQGDRERALVGDLQGISTRAIDEQQGNAMDAFNAQHARRFSMGGGSMGAGPSASKYLDMTSALARARADAMSQARIQGRSTAFGESNQAAQLLRGNPEAMAQMMGQAGAIRAGGQANMFNAIGQGIGQIGSAWDKPAGPSIQERYMEFLMGQNGFPGQQQQMPHGPQAGASPGFFVPGTGPDMRALYDRQNGGLRRLRAR